MRGLPARVDFVIVAQHVPWALVTRLCLIHTMLGVLGFLPQLEPQNTLDLRRDSSRVTNLLYLFAEQIVNFTIYILNLK